jgi:Icc-related predicted phosphoesterase
MKILIVSDIHFERHDYPKTFIDRLPEADVLIVAGDMIPFTDYNYRNVVYSLSNKYDDFIHIAGNHEFYGNGIKEGTLIAREEEHKQYSYVYLDNQVTTVGDTDLISIAGSTTWFPWVPEVDTERIYLNDYNYIKEFKKDPKVPHELNQKAIEFWCNVNADIWVMHHLPSKQSVHPKYEGDAFNCFFLSDMEEVIRERQPKLVIHGHTHDSFDYHIGETRVICNPYGYDTWNHKQLNKNFKHLIVEI